MYYWQTAGLIGLGNPAVSMLRMLVSAGCQLEVRMTLSQTVLQILLRANTREGESIKQLAVREGSCCGERRSCKGELDVRLGSSDHNVWLQENKEYKRDWVNIDKMATPSSGSYEWTLYAPSSLLTSTWLFQPRHSRCGGYLQGREANRAASALLRELCSWVRSLCLAMWWRKGERRL